MKDQQLENSVVTLHAKGWSVRRLSRELGISRGRVRRILVANTVVRDTTGGDEITPRKKRPVEILILNGYMCPYEVSTMVKLRSILPEFADRVIVRDVWLTPETLREYGAAKGVFINGRQKLVGGETEAAIRQAIQEEL